MTGEASRRGSDSIRPKLANRKEVKVLDGPVGREVRIDGKIYLNFTGSSYLGIGSRREIIRECQKELTRAGLIHDIGYGILGPGVHRVERAAAEFAGREAAIYYPSCYLAVLSIVMFLARDVNGVYLDENAHYSLRHAARLSGVPVIVFDHASPAQLRQAVKAIGKGNRFLILTDGIFPARGTIAPLPEYLRIAEGRGGTVVVDDAHAFGVLGANGRGTAEHWDLRPNQVVSVGSLSKAFCTHGGVVTGDSQLVDELRGGSDVYNGVTLPSNPIAAAAAAALELVTREPNLYKGLQTRAVEVKQALRSFGFEIVATPTPIIALDLGSWEANVTAFDRLLQKGILATLSQYPGAGRGSVLRLTLQASHRDADVDILLTELSHCAP